MTKKKGRQKFWEMDEILGGNADIKRSWKKFGPPVSEVLDPLVNIDAVYSKCYP